MKAEEIPLHFRCNVWLHTLQYLILFQGVLCALGFVLYLTTLLGAKTTRVYRGMTG